MREYVERLGLGVALSVGVCVMGVAAAKPPGFLVTSVSASFRCLVSSGPACLTDDKLRGDEAGTYIGNLSTGEGAFLNSNGGFSLRHVVNGGAERYVSIDLGIKTSSFPQCGLAPTILVAAAESDLRVNVEADGGGVVGIDNLTPGVGYPGFGILNYRDPNHANVWFTLRWEPGDLLVTKTTGQTGTTWDIRSNPDRGPIGHQVLVECTRQKGRNPGGREGMYSVPFVLTVHRP
jgi:hypothetical protein